mmetsp:Transcript_105605/g.182583  ORF Transcript_105605/g.182583 Transcript_105605/m.182583 type:complete len:240 (+) Transcript_105605:2-721(+)
MVQRWRRQPTRYAGDHVPTQADMKFPQQKASTSNQRLVMLTLGSPATQQMQVPPWMCTAQSALELQQGEVGSAAWAQAVKCAIQPCSESTTGSPGSDNMDARTSEDSLFELDNPHSQELFPDPLPVRHTFVHFDVKTTLPNLSKSRSAPEIMCKTSFQRLRNLEMEERHFKGECRPCAYFFHKVDGCRRGTECTFCHLCPPEAVKSKRKEKAQAMKKQSFARAGFSKQSQPYARSWQRK